MTVLTWLFPLQSDDYFALNGQDSISPQRHYAIHGHQDTAPTTVYDTVTAPMPNHRDTTLTAQYDTVRHALAHQKTPQPIPPARILPNTGLDACYDTITWTTKHQNTLPPDCYDIIGPSAPTNQVAALPACYDTIKPPPPNHQQAASLKTLLCAMDTTMQDGAYAIPSELDRNVCIWEFQTKKLPCMGLDF